MDPVAAFTVGTFEPRVGEPFAVPDAGVELRLAQVADYGAGAGAREGGAFSLFFHGPAEPMLPQAMHDLSHGEIGMFALFLVPVGRTAEGYEYEAAFN